jgi:hypothetical protein
MMNDDSDRPVRRALIVVSDGEDNQSEHSRAQAIEMAQRAQVIVYTISTDDSGLILRGDRVLQQLADSTGGRAFFPYKMKDIRTRSQQSKTNCAASTRSPITRRTSMPTDAIALFKSRPQEGPASSRTDRLFCP